jgi:hypothetical protein
MGSWASTMTVTMTGVTMIYVARVLGGAGLVVIFEQWGPEEHQCWQNEGAGAYWVRLGQCDMRGWGGVLTVRGTLGKPYEHSRNPYEVHETSSEAFEVLIMPLDHFARAYLPRITFEHAPSLWDIMICPPTDANIVRRLSNPTLYGRAASRVSGLASAFRPRRSSSSHRVVYNHTPCKGNLRLFSLVFPCKVSSNCTV